MVRELETTMQRKLRWTLILAGAGLVATGVAAYALGRQRALEKITAVDSSLTSTEGTPETPPPWRITEAPDLEFHVTLAHIPEGRSMDLTCDWIDPAGTVLHQNHWQTRPVDRDRWPTHCHHHFHAATTPGAWRVVLRHGDRALATAMFTLEK